MKKSSIANIGAVERVVTFYVETCRLQPLGTVKVKASDGERPFAAKARARTAMAKRFGVPNACLQCSSPMVDVHAKPSSSCQHFDLARRRNDDAHKLKLSAAARNRNASVFQVVRCHGDVLGHIAVLKSGTPAETARRAKRSMLRRFGGPGFCQVCEEPSRELHQVRGPICI